MSSIPIPLPDYSPEPPAEDPNSRISKIIRRYHDDPYGFVMVGYPWGEPGPLEHYDGPDKWQKEGLLYIRDQVQANRFDGLHPVLPIRIAVPSGHGTGKGAFAAWIVDWIMSTRPGSRGTVTANTAKQLSTKTWAAIQYWTRLCVTSNWFEITSEMMWFRGNNGKATWFTVALTCAPENAEAYQGQHAPTATSFYILDECSNIHPAIWNAAEGGLTDGEPMIFAFGQPTRADGEFFEITSGAKRNRWKSFPVDSRDSKFTSKDLINEWLEDYGEDSDFFRVRVRGLPPRAGDLQFISSDIVHQAQHREVAVLPEDPLIMGIDYARGGNDKVVIRFRKGRDARSVRPIKIPGEKARDSMWLATKIAQYITDNKPNAVFGDATGGSIGGPINDRLRQLGFNVIDVQYGGESPDKHYANMRAYMWAQCREWLKNGAIDADRELAQDLTGPISKHNKHDQVVLESKEEMKKRGLDSPDDGDALANTFCAPVVVRIPKKERPKQYYSPDSWMG